MNIQSFIETNPTPAEIAAVICAVANNNVLEIDETFAWSIAEFGGFTKADFVDDVQDTFDRHGAEALDVYGIKNWKRLTDLPDTRAAAYRSQKQEEALT